MIPQPMPLSNLTICVIILIIFLLYWSTESPPPQSAEQFGSAVSQPAKIILYYASWCPVCRNMHPEWVKFSKRTIPNLTISELRCEGGNETACFQKNITRYPTIILYLPNNKEIEYTGDRTDAALYAFVKQYV